MGSMTDNLILMTDSYKVGHWPFLPEGTTGNFAYFESRLGATFDFTIFVGLQPILLDILSKPITREDIEQAAMVSAIHFGTEEAFNRAGWEYILNEHGGYLPLEIKAVPEGTRVPVNNVLMTVQRTDDRCAWLVNYMESLLTHVWYPSTVATLSRSVKDMMLEFLEATGDPSVIDFMLHDFGYRGTTTNDAAGVGGMAHLINFMGTDTLLGMATAFEYYDAKLESLAFSVFATEHSIQTSLGKDGEYVIVQNVLDIVKTGIVSVVGDSYNIYDFTDYIVSIKDQILARDGRFVLRPDSTTPDHPTPESLVVWMLEQLYDGGGLGGFGGEYNDKGYLVLDTHVRILWGDGIDMEGIRKILQAAKDAGFSAENLVFGMGGGLLQKVNRDTQRFAFKSSAQERDGVWYDVQKEPLDTSKKSKAGRLKLIKVDGEFKTVRLEEDGVDLLETVFYNGNITKLYTFDEVRENARA